MRSKSAILLGLVLSPAAFAGSPALLCKQGERESFRLEPTSKRSIFVGEEIGFREGERTKVRLRLSGKAGPRVNREGKVFAGPSAIFGGYKEEGEYTSLLLETTKNEKGGYEIRYGHGSHQCVAGPAFKKLEKTIKKAPKISQERLNALSDSILAASCVKVDDPKAKYELRAMAYGFGNVSLQLNDRSVEYGGGGDYSAVSFGKGDTLVFKTSDKVAISYDGEKAGRLYFDLKGTKTKKDGTVHSAIVVPNLNDPSQPIYELSCVEEQMFRTILRYAKDAREMPKALPSVPGTLAQIDRALCEADKYGMARERASKWTKLIMDLPMPKGSHITGMMQSRDQNKCPTIVVSVSNRDGADAIRKAVGESIDGIRVELEIGDEEAEAAVAF